jgi:membrane protein implicated in regulation of membrane protease activity
MTWWVWALLGLGLAACEMLTPGGFYFLFFGLGAFVTSLLVWLDFAGPAWLQWFLFTAISLACLIPLRARFVRWATVPETTHVDSLLGEEVLLVDAVEPGGVGKGELRGSTWNVRTTGTQALARGKRVRVARVDGLTLWVDG